MPRLPAVRPRSSRQLRAAIVVVWTLLMISSSIGLMSEATETLGLAGVILGTILFLCAMF